MNSSSGAFWPTESGVVSSLTPNSAFSLSAIALLIKSSRLKLSPCIIFSALASFSNFLICSSVKPLSTNFCLCSFVKISSAGASASTGVSADVSSSATASV